MEKLEKYRYIDETTQVQHRPCIPQIDIYNLSPEKHINRISGDTFMMLRNIQMCFHFLDKDDEKNDNYNDQTKTGIYGIRTRKSSIEIRKNTENCN